MDGWQRLKLCWSFQALMHGAPHQFLLVIPHARILTLSLSPTGLQIEVDKFFIFTLTVFLTALGAASTAFFVSAGVRVAGVANLLIALMYVIQMVSWFFVFDFSMPCGCNPNSCSYSTCTSH